MIKQFKNKSYEERLRLLGLPTLKYRRLRGDMIELYKIMHDYYDSNISLTLKHSDTLHTRGNRYKLSVSHVHNDFRKYFFVGLHKVTNIWNSLPDKVVSETSIDRFKNALDKFWHNQSVKYDWKSELTVIGNRSQVYMYM